MISSRSCSLTAARWDGKPGETGDFAKKSAGNIGGTDVDLLYFEIGRALLRRSNGNTNEKSVDWPRLRRGYATLVSKYGSTNRLEKEWALRAFRQKDATIGPSPTEGLIPLGP